MRTGIWHRGPEGWYRTKTGADAARLVQTTSTSQPCPHANGWFDTVKLWPRSARVFVCTDCERIVPESSTSSTEAIK